jgi:parvulin-like peptidyl-prolyl isomerase
MATADDVKIVEQIVAKVNNEIITLGDLDRAHKHALTDLKRQQLAPAKAREAMEQTDRDALRDRIDQLLLVSKGKDLNVDVDQDLSKFLADVQLQSKIVDPDKFHEYIREQSGLSFEDFKQQTKDTMLTREVIRREVGGKIVIPKADLEKYYNEHKDEFVRQEQVRLQEIFLSTDGKDEKAVAAIEKKAKDLVARARKGENFGNLARDNSDAETASESGALPPFKRGDLRKDIEDLVFKESKGYVTDPFRQSNGLEILRIEEHYQAGLQSFATVQNEVMEKLYTPRMQPALRDFLTKLRRESFLEIRAGYVDTGAAPGKDTAWRDPAKLKPETVTKEEVAAHPHHKKLLWLIPIPGTKVSPQKPSGS